MKKPEEGDLIQAKDGDEVHSGVVESVLSAQFTFRDVHGILRFVLFGDRWEVLS